MKSYIFFLFVFTVSSMLCFAQPKTKTEPYKGSTDYGKKATQTITVDTDAQLKKVVTIEVKDSDGKVRERIVWKKDLTNKQTLEYERKTPGGRIEYQSVSKYDENNKCTHLECSRYEKGQWKATYTKFISDDKTKLTTKTRRDGEEDKETILIKDDGSIQIISEFDYFERGDRYIFDDLNKAEKDIENATIPTKLPIMPTCGPVEKVNKKSSDNCQPQADFFIGYNYINRDYEPDRIGMNGFTGAFTWYFQGSERTSFGIRLAGNTGTHKNGDEKISLQSYRLGPVLKFNTDGEIIPMAFILVGIGRDEFKIYDTKTTGSSFSASAGGNLDWFFTESLGARLSAEALLTKFNDESQWNFVGATGIVLRFGCKKTK